MTKKLYFLRNYFKVISLVGGVLSGLAALINLLAGDYIFVMLFVVCVLSVFQYRWATNPFIEIEGTKILIRLTMVITKQLDLLEVERVDTTNPKRIVLYPKVGKKITIGLNYLVEEDQNRLLLDIQAILEGRLNGDFSIHLVEED